VTLRLRARAESIDPVWAASRGESSLKSSLPNHSMLLAVASSAGAT
jgi:hypothetical protein